MSETRFSHNERKTETFNAEEHIKMLKLRQAILDGDVDLTKRLVFEDKVNINCKTGWIHYEDYGYIGNCEVSWGSLLHLAIKRSTNISTELIDVLIDAGADVNFQNNDPKHKVSPTLLQFAIKNGLPRQIIHCLLKRGADPNKKDQRGSNAIRYAVKVKSSILNDVEKIKLIKLLIRYGAVPYLHLSIIKACNGKLLNLLYNYGLFNNCSQTYLHLIISQSSNLKILVFFLKKNILNITETSRYDDQFLKSAIILKNDNVANFLLKYDFFEIRDVVSLSANSYIINILLSAITSNMIKTVRDILLKIFNFEKLKEDFSLFLAMIDIFFDKNIEPDLLFELLKHAAKIITIHQLRDENYFSWLVQFNRPTYSEDYQNMFDRCMDELERLKNHYVNKKVTLFDVLIMKKINIFVRNEKQVEAVFNVCPLTQTSTYDRNEKYPIYGSLISKRLKDEVDKLKLYNKVRLILANLTGLNLDVMYYILEKIMSYLTPQELIILSYL